MDEQTPLPAVADARLVPAFADARIGPVFDMPEDAYHASPGVSVSKLKLFSEEGGPAKVRYGAQQETQALSFGSLAHCAILTPELLEKNYQRTTLDRRGTKAWEAEEIAAGGRELTKGADFDAALLLRDSVHRHSRAGDLLRAANMREVSAFWRHEETGLLCRSRFDAVISSERALLDLKSSGDASRHGFARSVAEYLYHWQDAFYRHAASQALGWWPDAFIFMVVEKAPPHMLALYEVEAADLKRADEAIATQLRRWAECESTGVWPAYPEHIQSIELPPWRARIDDDLIMGG